jgi:hypothetical protein
MMLERLDFWLAVFVLGMLAWYELRLGRLFGPLARGLYSVLTSSREAPPEVRPRSDRSNDMRERSALPDAIVQDVQRSNVQAEPPGMDPPTLQELRQLVQAVAHNARGANKQQSIEQAFGVKKGGSAGWRRASQLFDEATKAPEVER